MKKTLLFILLAAFTSLLIMPSCKKDKGPEPKLPPKESMIQALTLGENKALAQTQSDTAFADASLRVGVWNTILFVGLAVPVGTFLKAFENSPKWDKNKKVYVWSYPVYYGLLTYQAKLEGVVDGDSSRWKMYISHENDFQDFLWYEGASHTGDLGGRWILNESPEKNNPLLHILWSRNNLNSTVAIKYTNICPPGIAPYGEGNGSYISYGSMNGEYDRFYIIYSSNPQNQAEIEWSTVDEHGHIRDQMKYNNVWHCWDQSQQDMICN